MGGSIRGVAGLQPLLSARNSSTRCTVIKHDGAAQRRNDRHVEMSPRFARHPPLNGRDERTNDSRHVWRGTLISALPDHLISVLCDAYSYSSRLTSTPSTNSH